MEKGFQIVNMFPILLMKFPKFLTEEQCEDIAIHFGNYEGFRQHPYFTNDALCSHGSENILDKIVKLDSCVDIISNIDAALQLYADTVGYEKKNISNSWMNLQNKGSALFDHMHGGSTVTGAIFVKFYPGNNNLTFTNLNHFVDYFEPKIQTVYNARTHSVTPEVGDMYLFPSWIKHGSNGVENTSDGRMSIAFNTCE